MSGTGKAVFSELESQNPAVAKALRGLRQQGKLHTTPPHPAPDPTPPWRPVPVPVQGVTQLIGDLVHSDSPFSKGILPVASAPAPAVSASSRRFAGPLLGIVGIVLVGYVIGPAVLHFLMANWRAILLPIGGLCIGLSTITLGARVGNSPLASLKPPYEDAEDPLQELKDLAERTALRLRTTFRLQLWTVGAVGMTFLALIIWSIILVTRHQVVYASAFGSGSLGMVILTRWKWQPFDRIDQARRLADNADTLATGLRLRMRTIAEIQDSSARAKAQWEAVNDYLKHT
jgi:hypothetical protein